MKGKPLLFLLFTNFILCELYGQVNSTLEQTIISYINGDHAVGEAIVVKPKNLYRPFEFRSSNIWVTLTGNNIESFQVEETKQLFVSYNKMIEAIDRSVPKSTSTFYKVLVQGEATLYYSIDSLNKEHYFVKKNNVLIRIDKSKNTSKYIDGTNYINKENIDYWKVNVLLSDCLGEESHFLFNNFYLLKKVIAYNKCVGSSVEVPKKAHAKIMIGGVFGFSTSTITFSDKHTLSDPYGYAFNGYIKGTYDLSTLIKETPSQSSSFVGLSVSIFPLWNKHFSFEFQPGLISREWSSETQKINMKSKYLEIPTLLKINFGLQNSLQPTFGFGFNPSISIQSSYDSEPLTRAFDAEPYFGGQSFPKITTVEIPTILPREYSPSQLKAVLSLGLDFFTKSSKTSLDYRYEFLGSLTDSHLYSTSYSSHNFLFSFSLLTNKRNRR